MFLNNPRRDSPQAIPRADGVGAFGDMTMSKKRKEMTTTTTTAQPEANPVAEALRRLEAFARGTLAAATSLKEANDAVGSLYNQAISAAIVAGNGKAWGEAIDALYDEIRTNRDGIAVACGAKPGKSGGFIVPNMVANAKNILSGCYEHALPLVDKETGKPFTFSQLRKSYAAAKDAADRAKLTGDDLLRQLCKDGAARLIELLDKKGADGAYVIRGDLLHKVAAFLNVGKSEPKTEASAEVAKAA